MRRRRARRAFQNTNIFECQKCLATTQVNPRKRISTGNTPTGHAPGARKVIRFRPEMLILAVTAFAWMSSVSPLAVGQRNTGSPAHPTGHVSAASTGSWTTAVARHKSTTIPLATSSTSTSSTSGGTYVPITPKRLADTRCGTSPTPSFCTSENLPTANATLSPLSTVGYSAWSSPYTIDSDNEINLVSCPTAVFCMALNYNGPVFSWNGKSWLSLASVNDPNGSGISGLSCASSSFCAIVDNNGNVLTWNGSNWSAPDSIDPNGDGFASVSCPSTSFCKTVDNNGNVLTWNGNSWSTALSVDPNNLPDTISCPNTSFCMISDSSGNILTYSAGSWSKPLLIDPNAGTLHSSCASATFCAAVDDFGHALTWNGNSWSKLDSIDPSTGFNAVSCPATNFCTAVDATGNAFSWNGTSWSTANSIDPGSTPLQSISCPSALFCAAGDFTGNVLVYEAQPLHPTITVQVSGVDSIPSGALDAVLNITVTGATSPGYLTVYPASTSEPPVSNLNFSADQTVANLVEVALSSVGQVDVTLGGSVRSANAIVDIEGYVPATQTTGYTYTAIPPERIVDTRCFNSSYSSTNAGYCKGIPNLVLPTGEVPGGGSATVTMPSSFSSATAIVANLTVTGTGTSGYLTAYPAGSSVPTTSNLNFTTGATVANRIEVGLASGAFSVFNGSSTPVNIVVDLNGIYSNTTGALFEGVTPERIVDTRCGTSPPPNFCSRENIPAANASLTRLGPGATIQVQVSSATGFPSGASALVANLTAIAPSQSGYLTVFPAGSTMPIISDVNFSAHVTAIPNMTVAELGSNDSLEIYNGSSGSVDVALDVTGFFAGG